MGSGPKVIEEPRDEVADAFAHNEAVRSKVASQNAIRRAEIEAAFTRDLSGLNKELSSLESQRSRLRNQIPDLDIELMRAQNALEVAEKQNSQFEAQQAVFGNLNFDFDLEGKRQAVADVQSKRDSINSQIADLTAQSRSLAENAATSADVTGINLDPNQLRGAGSNVAERNPGFGETFRSNQASFERSEALSDQKLFDRLGGSSVSEIALSNLESQLAREADLDAQRQAEIDAILGKKAETAAAETAAGNQAAAASSVVGGGTGDAKTSTAESEGATLGKLPATTADTTTLSKTLASQSNMLTSSNEQNPSQAAVLVNTPKKLGGS